MDPVIKRKISDREKTDIKEAFELFDTNHDGFINYHELKVLLFKLFAFIILFIYISKTIYISLFL